MQENAWVHSVRLPKLVALSSAPLSLSDRIFCSRREGMRWDDQTRWEGGTEGARATLQQCHATTTRSQRHRPEEQTGGPAPTPAATRQETAAPQQVRPPGAEPARFAGNSFLHPPCFLFIYCLQQQKQQDTRLPGELLPELRLTLLGAFLPFTFAFFLPFSYSVHPRVIFLRWTCWVAYGHTFIVSY